jgi:hypothetical protein
MSPVRRGMSSFRPAAVEAVEVRQVRCGECRRLFVICRPCDHGRVYCDDACRSQSRRRIVRACRARHRRSPDGRADHRDRQRAYRRQVRADRVVDPGAQKLAKVGEVACASAEESEKLLPVESKETPFEVILPLQGDDVAEKSAVVAQNSLTYPLCCERCGRPAERIRMGPWPKRGSPLKQQLARAGPRRPRSALRR